MVGGWNQGTSGSRDASEGTRVVRLGAEFGQRSPAQFWASSVRKSSVLFKWECPKQLEVRNGSSNPT